MKRDKTIFLQELRVRAQQNLRLLEGLAQLPEEALQARPGDKAWTALEALKHINTFNRAYQGRAAEAIRRNRSTRAPREFRSGFLGGIIANWARPGATTIKLPAPKKVNYHGRPLDREVLEQSLTDARELLDLLDDAESVDLTTTKIGSLEAAWFKLRLGDTLRLIVNHDWRHIEQAERATRGEAGIRTK